MLFLIVAMMISELCFFLTFRMMISGLCVAFDCYGDV